jgi:hypothetical protein
MGNQTMILIVGTLLVVSLFVATLMQTGNDMTKNTAAGFADYTAKEINNTAVEVAMRTIADSAQWRGTLSNLQLSGGTSTVVVKDTVIGGDSTMIVVRSQTVYSAGNRDTSRAFSQVVVKPAGGFVPPVVRGAFTAFGPLNDAISDMFIDGRNYAADGVTIIPKTGVFAVSTGAGTFVNTQKGYLGGTTYATSPATDLVPAYPHDARTVETSSYWPNGWPLTPDAALGGPANGFPEGTLKRMAQQNLIPGSRYVTAWNQLSFPLKGITYMDVPNGYYLSKKHLGNNPEGILVLHSPATDAFWDNITVNNGAPFKGIMLMDNVFHIHMDVLGAIVVLTPNTVVGKTCNGNANHFVRFSSQILESVTGGTGQAADASWKSKFKVISWYE